MQHLVKNCSVSLPRGVVATLTWMLPLVSQCCCEFLAAIVLASHYFVPGFPSNKVILIFLEKVQTAN